MLTSIIRALQAYADNPDPITGVANRIALVVASNLPFYPLYLYWIVGSAAWPACIAMLTMPAFAIVPAVARRHALAGRALLQVTGVINTVLCAKALGLDSGIELFLLPCALIATLLFKPGERIVQMLLLAFTFGVYLFIDPRLGAPLQIYSSDAYRSMIALNAMSVASLTALLGFLVSSAIHKEKHTA